MKELAKHIEVLLLEHDCVIVPGLGGFIAHYRSAYYDSTEKRYYPPTRSIGFNPQLTINDGLLVQSYMKAYNTDFPDATRKIEQVVVQIKDILYHDGELFINHVGTLYNNVNGVYEFLPTENGFFTPSLYGLQTSFLTQLSHQQSLTTSIKQESTQSSRTIVSQARETNIFVRYIATIAAAVFLFLILSSKVENTDIYQSEYASIGSRSLLDAIRMESLMTTAPEFPAKQSDSVTMQQVSPNQNSIDTIHKQLQNNISTKPKTTPQADATLYYVIVASLNTLEGAKTEVVRLRKAGFEQLEILSTSHIHRIAVAQYTSEAEAYKKINELREKGLVETAWVLTH